MNSNPKPAVDAHQISLDLDGLDELLVSTDAYGVAGEGSPVAAPHSPAEVRHASTSSNPKFDRQHAVNKEPDSHRTSQFVQFSDSGESYLNNQIAQFPESDESYLNNQIAQFSESDESYLNNQIAQFSESGESYLSNQIAQFPESVQSYLSSQFSELAQSQPQMLIPEEQSPSSEVTEQAHWFEQGSKLLQPEHSPQPNHAEHVEPSQESEFELIIMLLDQVRNLNEHVKDAKDRLVRANERMSSLATMVQLQSNKLELLPYYQHETEKVFELEKQISSLRQEVAMLRQSWWKKLLRWLPV